jgi:hypothetical protein
VGATGDPVQPGSDQDRPQLSASSQGGLKPWPAVILAAGYVGELPDQRPALDGDKSADTGLLGCKSKATVTLLRRGNTVEGNGVARIR